METKESVKPVSIPTKSLFIETLITVLSLGILLAALWETTYSTRAIMNRSKGEDFKLKNSRSRPGIVNSIKMSLFSC